MADETALVAAWVTSQLADLEHADGEAVGVFEGIAPIGAREPCIVFGFVVSPNVLTASGEVVWSRADIDVKAVCEGGSFAPLTAFAEGIQSRLHGARYVTTATGTVLSSRRTANLRYTETTGGKVYRHLGGTYRIEARGE